MKIKTFAAAILAGALSCLPAPADEPLTVSGDMRARAQWFINRMNRQPDVKALDTRVRLNIDYRLSDKVNARVRGVAESSSVPNLDARLQDEEDVGYEFSVDRVCLTWTPMVRFSLAAGEIDNPFAATIPHIDRDMPVLGVSAVAKPLDWLALQAVYDAGRQLTQDSKSKTVGAQAVAQKYFGSIKLSANLGYQHVHDFDLDYKLSNSADVDFDVLSAGASVTVPTPIAPTTLFLEVVHNASMEEDNDGYMAGIKIGEAKQPGTLALTLQYRYIEKDAMLAGTTVRDSPRTNIDLLTARLDWRVSKDMTVYLFSGNPQHIIPAGLRDDERQNALEFGLQIDF